MYWRQDEWILFNPLLLKSTSHCCLLATMAVHSVLHMLLFTAKLTPNVVTGKDYSNMTVLGIACKQFGPNPPTHTTLGACVWTGLGVNTKLNKLHLLKPQNTYYSILSYTDQRVVLTTELHWVYSILTKYTECDCVTSWSSQGQRQMADSSTEKLPNPTTRTETLKGKINSKTMW